MDQGDNQLPLDFDIDWTAFDDDWGSSGFMHRELGEAGYVPLLSSDFEALSPELLGDTLWPPPIWSETLMRWECQSISDLATVTVNTDDGIFQSSGLNLHVDSSLPLLDYDPNWALEVGLDERASTRPDNSLDPRATIHSLENQSGFSGTFAPEPLLPARDTQLRQSRPVVDSQRSYKPRLLCPHTGCKFTFPRKYELQRHEKNVHNRTFSLLCPIYGCNRSSKPFGRLDKLNEHWRKHQRPDKFLCPIESCRAGSFCMADLRDHLKAGHSQVQLNQPHLDDLLCMLDCNLKITPAGDGLVCLDDRDVCPLAFLGCGFWPSLRHGHGRESLRSHISEHELINLSNA